MKQIYIKLDFSNATNSNTFIRNEHFDMHKTDFARLCLWAFYCIVRRPYAARTDVTHFFK